MHTSVHHRRGGMVILPFPSIYKMSILPTSTHIVISSLVHYSIRLCLVLQIHNGVTSFSDVIHCILLWAGLRHNLFQINSSGIAKSLLSSCSEILQITNPQDHWFIEGRLNWSSFPPKKNTNAKGGWVVTKITSSFVLVWWSSLRLNSKISPYTNLLVVFTVFF